MLPVFSSFLFSTETIILIKPKRKFVCFGAQNIRSEFNLNGRLAEGYIHYSDFVSDKFC